MGGVNLRLVVRATLVVVVVAVIASTFSGSGSWDAHLTPQEAVIAAGGRTVAVGSARVLRTERQTDSTGKQVSASTSEGVVDFERKLVRYERFMPKGVAVSSPSCWLVTCSTGGPVSLG